MVFSADCGPRCVCLTWGLGRGASPFPSLTPTRACPPAWEAEAGASLPPPAHGVTSPYGAFLLPHLPTPRLDSPSVAPWREHPPRPKTAVSSLDSWEGSALTVFQASGLSMTEAHSIPFTRGRAHAGGSRGHSLTSTRAFPYRLFSLFSNVDFC